MQEDTRIDRDEGGKNLSIGYYIMKVTGANNFCTDKGCVSLGKSESGFLIQDHSDYGASKERTNPYPEWIRRFL